MRKKRPEERCPGIKALSHDQDLAYRFELPHNHDGDVAYRLGPPRNHDRDVAYRPILRTGMSGTWRMA